MCIDFHYNNINKHIQWERLYLHIPEREIPVCPAHGCAVPTLKCHPWVRV